MFTKKEKVKVPEKQCGTCPGNYSPHHSGGAGSYSTNFKVDDPVQGPVGDCYLISALASIAWADPRRLNNYPIYQFLGTPVTNVDLRNNDSMNVLLNSQSSPVGAQLGIYNNNWPLLYEKAYAVAKGCPNWGQTSCPDISKIGGGVGLTTLKQVFRTNNSNSFTINFGSDGEATMVTKLNACSSPTNGKAIRAAVAWTNAATAEIRKDHTYSYLGYYKDSANNYHLVLRDPCRTEPGTNVATSGNWLVNFATLNDGIFALKFSAITTTLNIGYVW
jgi:hypothetical protein